MSAISNVETVSMRVGSKSCKDLDPVLQLASGSFFVPRF